MLKLKAALDFLDVLGDLVEPEDVSKVLSLRISA